MILRADETGSAFEEAVLFQSNQRNIDAKNITVYRESGNSYAFNVTIQLNLGEIITLYTNWIAQARFAGTYNVILSGFSSDPDVDPRFRTCQDTSEIQIVEDIPIVSEPLLSPVYGLSELGPKEMYVYPERDIEVRCNVTSPRDMENVTLYYSVDALEFWTPVTMVRNLSDEWTGTVPGQPEGKRILLYVEAFSITGRNAITREYSLTVSNPQALETKTRMIAAATAATIIVGCFAIVARKRRKMAEIL